VISENYRTCDFRKLPIIDIEPWKMNQFTYKKKDTGYEYEIGAA
jgi:hypothetical protein